MNWIGGSVWLWIAGAIAVFWVVGAYNRLVRLRSAALHSYAALDGLLARQLDFVQTADAEPASGGGRRTDHAALQAAAMQAAILLGATRAKPLDPDAIASLGTALHVLLSAWERLHPDAIVHFEADGTLSRPASLTGSHEPAEILAPAESMAWPEPSALVEITRAQFNAAVAQYNAAIGQLPALFVAWAFRFRPAAPLV